MKNRMKVQIGCAAFAAALLGGCVHPTNETVDETVAGGGDAYQRYQCKHVRLKKILGVDDAVLADTNRFTLAAQSYGHGIKLDAPLWGFSEARFYLDEMELGCARTVRDKPHQLRSVELKRVLADGTDSDQLLVEAQKVCDEIGKLLDVETPEVRLADPEQWGKSHRGECMGGIRTCVCFELAEGQELQLRLIEGCYAVRGGRQILVSAPRMELDIDFNEKLNQLPCCMVLREVKSTVAVDHEIEIGTNQSEKLARAMRESVSRKEGGVGSSPEACCDSTCRANCQERDEYCQCRSGEVIFDCQIQIKGEEHHE